MKKYFLFSAAILMAAFFSAVSAAAGAGSRADARNALKSLYTPDYLILKQWIMSQFKDSKPGQFGEFVKGVMKGMNTEQKVIALTFDACGGRHSGYNVKLIEYLRAEKIPATLFVAGIWIDQNPEIFMDLAKDPLFEIENHGLLHRVCSVNGQSVYGVKSTRDVGDVIDEMELNARKIAAITGRRPVFFRSATAYTDEASAEVARRLGMEVVSYDILSGDAMHSSAATMARNLVKGARHGAVVIMHFNHPEWHELEALREAVPELRVKGYTFGRMEDFPAKAAGEQK
jgi:peptidoglycan/xylan/chitin deacetylase (PgdA/CDA1 family)